jgi:hypothetical protein
MFECSGEGYYFLLEVFFLPFVPPIGAIKNVSDVVDLSVYCNYYKATLMSVFTYETVASTLVLTNSVEANRAYFYKITR